MREALPQQIILSKLPLVRFCQPTDPKAVRYWYGLLAGSHVSFAICSGSGRVLAVIDIEGDRAPSRRAATIKQSVLAACRVRHLSCRPDRLPSVPELQLLVPPPGAAVGQAAAMDANAARRERKALWQDSGFMQDSFFGMDGRGGIGSSSGFGPSRQQAVPPQTPAMPDDIGGVVIDTPVSPLRH